MDKSDDAAVQSARIAATAVRNWQEMSVRLSPIIGEEGFRLLYKRSLHLAASKIPWLARMPAAADASFSGLEAALEREAPAMAGEASQALLTTFTGLLHTLIGEGLTTRLLAPLPREQDPDEQQEVSP